MTPAPRDLQALAGELRSKRAPFVRATVVRAEKPSSARAGDAALVLDDGTIVGFVGGECTETSVRGQSLQALRTGEPVLLRISPDVPPAADPSVVAVGGGGGGAIALHNPCLSGGTVEIFLAPELPPPIMVLHGQAPIARALEGFAALLGYEVVPPGPKPDVVPARTSAVIVAAHGRDEADVLLAAVEAEVPYIGLVASPRRGGAVLDALGLEDDVRARIRTPVGLDIGARTPEEVAVSILAELISLRPARARRAGAGAGSGAGDASPAPAMAIDPVCGMTVPEIDATLHVVHAEETIWFCGSGCRDAYVAEHGLHL